MKQSRSMLFRKNQETQQQIFALSKHVSSVFIFKIVKRTDQLFTIKNTPELCQVLLNTFGKELSYTFQKYYD